MNITVNKSKDRGGSIQIIYPEKIHAQKRNSTEESSKPAMQSGLCGSFLTRLCVDHQSIDPSQQNQVFENNRDLPSSSGIRRLNPKNNQQSSRRKISLSISRSESHLQTPKKQFGQGNNSKYHSQKKRIKTHTCFSTKNQYNSPGESKNRNTTA